MVVSMGNVAASGGYYISGGCPSHFNIGQRGLCCCTYPRQLARRAGLSSRREEEWSWSPPLQSSLIPAAE